VVKGPIPDSVSCEITAGVNLSHYVRRHYRFGTRRQASQLGPLLPAITGRNCQDHYESWAAEARLACQLQSYPAATNHNSRGAASRCSGFAHDLPRSQAMVNQQTLQGNWNELKGKLRTKWGQLTNDE